MIFSAVLLPEPDGPTMATVSPAAISQIDAAQDIDGIAAIGRAVGFGDVAKLEEHGGENDTA